MMKVAYSNKSTYHSLDPEQTAPTNAKSALFAILQAHFKKICEKQKSSRSEGVFDDNLGYFLLFLHKNVCCDPSSSVEGLQHIVSIRNKKNYPSIIIKYPLLSRALSKTVLPPGLHFKIGCLIPILIFPDLFQFSIPCKDPKSILYPYFNSA